jgi:hypothetical protein
MPRRAPAGAGSLEQIHGVGQLVHIGIEQSGGVRSHRGEEGTPGKLRTSVRIVGRRLGEFAITARERHPHQLRLVRDIRPQPREHVFARWLAIARSH